MIIIYIPVNVCWYLFFRRDYVRYMLPYSALD